MLEMIFLGAALLVVALAAPRYGVDSHTSDSWTADPGEAAPRGRHTVRADLSALWALVRTPTGRGARA